MTSFSVKIKKSFLAGDFNFDLLHTENNETFNFFVNMSSHMLPTITIPKSTQQRTQSSINIFTNQLHPDMKSGNLTLAITDHLP